MEEILAFGSRAAIARRLAGDVLELLPETFQRHREK
jgi:hypothetical protein